MVSMTNPISECPNASEHKINILVATFPGLGLPRTLSLPTCALSPTSNVHRAILARLPNGPEAYERLIITTVSNKQLLSYDQTPISSFLNSPTDGLLSVRISAPLCGGKGGFGSQLRAAGGRMSSRKNRDRQDQNVNGSNRNLDGRRLRTVNEAKKLAEYLALKPEMEQRERDERKKRWEAVVEAADKREYEIKSGKAGSNQGRLNADYVEGKEQAEEKTREAMAKAMREGLLHGEHRTGSESEDDAGADSGEDDGEASSSSSGPPAGNGKDPARNTRFFGWDEDDYEDDDDEDEVEENHNLDQSHASTA